MSDGAQRAIAFLGGKLQLIVPPMLMQQCVSSQQMRPPLF
jgi:hypothetical protein